MVLRVFPITFNTPSRAARTRTSSVPSVFPQFRYSNGRLNPPTDFVRSGNLFTPLKLRLVGPIARLHVDIRTFWDLDWPGTSRAVSDSRSFNAPKPLRGRRARYARSRV